MDNSNWWGVALWALALFGALLVSMAVADSRAADARMAAGVAPATHFELRSGQVYVRDPDGGLQPLASYLEFSPGGDLIDTKYGAMLRDHAAFLRLHPKTSLLLRGHSRAFGSRNFSLAVSASRVSAVQGYLLAQGVRRSQIDAVSYGEEPSPWNAPETAAQADGLEELHPSAVHGRRSDPHPSAEEITVAGGGDRVFLIYRQFDAGG